MFGFLGRCPYYSMFRTFIVNELFLRMMGFLDIGKLGKDHCEITTKFQKRLIKWSILICKPPKKLRGEAVSNLSDKMLC